MHSLVEASSDSGTAMASKNTAPTMDGGATRPKGLPQHWINIRTSKKRTKHLLLLLSKIFANLP
jgi:hypothetical protein